uniref:Cytochrome P450 n=1 Tax=Catharanthus roseus TaxID=4058 RepID=Q9XFZ0_CATRO|nr:cytochrome P450 [Catharanthus roseus]
MALASIEKVATGLICFILLIFSLKRIGHPRDWALVGILSVWFPSLGHIYEKLAKSLAKNDKTFVLKGSFLSKQDVIFTCDPANMHHVMSTNFSNYPKGPENRNVFDVYGEMLFTADHEKWKSHRKVTNAYFHDQRFNGFSQKVNKEVIEKELFPFLDHAAEEALVFDLQDVFQRLMLDSSSILTTGQNHRSLRVGLPYDETLEAINIANYQIFVRHILPAKIWKFQKWLGIMGEKKIKKAWRILDDISVEYMNRRKKEISSTISSQEDMDVVKFSEEDHVVLKSVDASDNLLRDTVKGILLAGTDTTATVLSWFFWLILKNPRVEQKIREEIELYLKQKNGEHGLYTNPEELNELMYLHAAIYETMRLYPAAPFTSRKSIQADVFPTGHQVNPNTTIVMAYYAVGRMKSIWGEDCLEFKPERWLSDKGKLIPVQTNKFLAFGTGPRICPGKELGLNRVKAVAAAIIPKYSFKIMRNKPVMPAACATLYLKDGLIVRVNKII